MRSLKKVLTLALVFVMAIGLLTAGALDFTDADDIQYKEAVEVMTGIGAINGYTDGTFGPDGLVTRAEAAKLVAYTVLTHQVAQHLPKETISFTDTVGHWAAPYIEYCASQGIIKGRGNGKFDPNGNVTAIELAAMLLRAVGYGKNGEYEGASWSIYVLTDAVGHGIFNGSKATDYAAPATREEAALYFFNVIHPTTGINQVNWDKTIDDYVSSGKGRIGSKYSLTKDTSPVNGVEGYTWKIGTKAVSSFYPTEIVLGTSMDGTSIADLTNPLNKAYIASLNLDENDDPDVDYFYNGRELDLSDSDDDDALLDAAKKRGVIVSLITTDADKDADKVVIIEKQVAGLQSAPSLTRDGKVRIQGVVTEAGGVEPKYVPGYEDLAAGDVVLYYKNETTGVYHIEKAEAVEGKITARKTVSGEYEIVFGGVTYKQSDIAKSSNLFANIAAGEFNVDAVLYLDNGGFVVEYKADSDTTSTGAFAVLLDYATIPQSGWTQGHDEAKLLFTDGTVKTVVLAKGNLSEITGDGDEDEDEKKEEVVDRFYEYTVSTTTGAYTLKLVDSSEIALEGSVVVPNKARFTDDTDDPLANTATVFILPGTTPNTFVVYTGIANVPELENAKLYAVVEDGLAKYVYVAEGKLSADVDEDLVYFVNVEDYTEYPGTDPYREYAAIVDGELTTVKVAANVVVDTSDDDDIDDLGVGLYTVVYTDGVITSADAVNTNAGVGTIGASNGILTVGTSSSKEYYTYNSKTIVFFIEDGEVTESTVAYIEKDENDNYAIITGAPTNSELAVIVFIEVVAND